MSRSGRICILKGTEYEMYARVANEAHRKRMNKVAVDFAVNLTLFNAKVGFDSNVRLADLSTIPKHSYNTKSRI
jgi:hypothetical protein